MQNIKCAECGLVNWSAEVECKRCGSLLTVQDKRAQHTVAVEKFNSPPLFSGGLKFLVVILGLAVLAIFPSRVLQLVDADFSKLLAIVFMMAGIGFLLLSHIWLVIRIFEQSVAWGLGSLCLPFVGLIAVVKFWDNTKRSFVGQLVCFGIIFAGYAIVPSP
jgi:hypothetical protein